MELQQRSGRRQGNLSFAGSGSRFGSTKLATAMVRGVLMLAVLAALVLMAALPAQGQTETVLYNFCSQANCLDGFVPEGTLTFDSAGNLYGTTVYGGVYGLTGPGTVFELSPNGNGGWNESVLYNFAGGTDGANPWSNVIFDSAGNLYGTTYFGGGGYDYCEYGCGTVFELSPTGSGWTETILHAFSGSDGYYPQGNLMMDSAGNIYGTTEESVFELSPSGGGWTFETIYQNDETFLGGGMMMDGAGNLYGASNKYVFELSPNGEGGWQEPRNLYGFTSTEEKNGSFPTGSLVMFEGNIYGVIGREEKGGKVYSLSQITSGKHKGQWRFTALHSFTGGTKNGSDAWGGLLLWPGPYNSYYLFGATAGGGEYCKGGCGTVYGLGWEGLNQWIFQLLVSFNDSDGAGPCSSLIPDSAGNLYGTTEGGGIGAWDNYSGGTVFEVTGATLVKQNGGSADRR